MTRQEQMVQQLDRDVERTLAMYDQDSGRLMQPSLTTDTRYTAAALSLLLTAYAHPGSRFFSHPEVLGCANGAIRYLETARRTSGCFDLSSCNFDSAPDTAFAVNALIDVCDLLMVSRVPRRDELLGSLEGIIEKACEGICQGGFHTPNHRWAISAALKHASRLTDREDFSLRADRYLAEGLDISGEGEFAERSAGIYNVVNDEQMIRLYLATGDVQYLRAARENLEMMTSYLEPDGSVFTLHSTRQDRGRTLYPGNYYILYLLVGYLQKDPDFAALSRPIWDWSTAGGQVPRGLGWLMRYPELEAYGELGTPDLRRFTEYSRIFEESGIARWRHGDFSVTAMTGKPDCLCVQKGSMRLGLSFYGNVCEKRNFVAQSLTRTEDGCELRCRMDSWYYLPFADDGEGAGPGTSDWWKMDNEHQRTRQVRAVLDWIVTLRVWEDHVRVTLRTEGLDRVPIRAELAFTPCEVRGDSFLLSGEPGQAMTVASGSLEARGREGDLLTVTPCFASHHVMNAMGGAYPRQQDRFTVYLTCFSPCERDLVIGTRPIFPPSLTE